jgi:DNA invertase Pin-like site-specific DNA recombinase
MEEIMKERVKAFGYLRVSGKSQVNGFGFDRQEETIQNFADKAGYEIVRIFKEEAVSGTKSENERPAFQEMIAEILRDGIKTVLIEGLDRLAREYRIQETLLIYLASKGISLISARTEENVTDELHADPMKKALIQIQGIFAELEKNLLVKKLRHARERVIAEKGKCGGQPAYSEISPEVIMEIKKLRKKPKGKARKTYIEIANELSRRGFKTARGKNFTGQIVQNILRK